ncbi:MAG: class I SAM-dependent methyltransferase [Acidimicrobiia bacterium]
MSTAPPEGYWFGPVAQFLGPAYLRNAFTKGTTQEIDFLWNELGFASGQSVLDIGCGPGRHALELSRRGITAIGIDASEEFVALAREAAEGEHLNARFEVADVRELAYESEFDAAICLCQGGFGLLGGRDEVDVFHRIVRAVKPGGPIAVSAFHAPFAVRFLEEGESFNPATGVLHERSTVRNSAGDEQDFDLWTTCFTTRELELLAALAGMDAQAVYGVTPGRYRAVPPDLDAPELLLVGRRRA